MRMCMNGDWLDKSMNLPSFVENDLDRHNLEFLGVKTDFQAAWYGFDFDRYGPVRDILYVRGDKQDFIDFLSEYGYDEAAEEYGVSLDDWIDEDTEAFIDLL